jgi:hypothetical protein
LSDSCGKACECSHFCRVLNPLYKRVQSQRPDILGPVVPMCVPIFGSRCHSASVISCICNTEITRVIVFEPNRKIVQDACCGRGNLLLNKVRNSVSDLQSHSCTLPKDRDGISVSAFSTPGMCTGVSGHVCLMLMRSASARTS